jgi:ribonuclease R
LKRKQSGSKRTSPSKSPAKPRQFGGRGRGDGAGKARGPSRAQGISEGMVSAHRSGFGFVRVEGMEESVFLPPRQMAGVMTGDRVRVAVTRAPDGRFSGELLEILSHGVSSFLGTMEVAGRSAWVHAVDRRLGLRAFVPPEAVNGARAGEWVIASITRHATPEQGATAAVVKRLDPLRPLEMATESAIAKYSLPVEFPPEVLGEAERFGDQVDPEESRRRVDLRDMPLVTIDGADAKDYDDAVFAEPSEQGFRLVVAIADVSHYVRIGSALDAEAQKRGTSVYFPRQVLPMLPTALSDNLCSLAPRVDRLCFVADMQVSKTGQLKGAKFYPAVMRSHARLTYDLVHAALFDRKVEARTQIGSLVEQLEPLVEVYGALLKARRRRGALDFESSEATFEFDTSQAVREVGRYARNEAHKLIEECMILANVAVAAELRTAQVPALFRVHGQPEERKLNLLSEVLATMGFAVELPEEPVPRDLREITERLGSRPERPFVESLVVRAMPQAIYQPANIGHFGLALREYAHFTSPIRRYPDLVVHRALKARLSESDRSGRRYAPEELASLGESTSRLEKRADEADRYVDTYLKCAYLRERLGQTFEGIVTTVVEFGCFVQLLDVGIDGLLHLDNLSDDEYRMESHGHAWVGRQSKRSFGPGTKLRVIVTNANPVEGLVDLELG